MIPLVQHNSDGIIIFDSPLQGIVESDVRPNGNRRIAYCSKVTDVVIYGELGVHELCWIIPQHW